jgi:hypothetical protein
MQVLQWLGPLFVGVFGSASPISVGDNGLYPESSTRIFGQDYSKVWSTNLSNTNLSTRNSTISPALRWYNSEPDMSAPEVATEDMPWTYFTDGAEFRIDDKKGPLFGFEWRIIDYLPDEYLQNVVQCVILCADHALERPLNYEVVLNEITYFLDDEDDNPNTNQFIKMAKDIFMEGWNTPIDNRVAQRYIEILNLGELSQTLTVPITAYSLLSDIMNLLFDRYGRVSQHQRKPNGKMCKLMLRKADSHYYRNFSLLNWNKMSWEHIMSKDGFLNGSQKLLETLKQKLKLGKPKEVKTKEDLRSLLLTIPQYQSFLKEDLDDLWYYLKTINVIQ